MHNMSPFSQYITFHIHECARGPPGFSRIYVHDVNCVISGWTYIHNLYLQFALTVLTCLRDKLLNSSVHFKLLGSIIQAIADFTGHVPNHNSTPKSTHFLHFCVYSCYWYPSG